MRRDLNDEIRSSLGGRGAAAFAAWQASAGVLGIVLPTLLESRHRHQPAVSAALLAYRNLLLVQIGIEGVLARALSPSAAVPTGLVFTSLRLAQLQHLAQAAKGVGPLGRPVPAAHRLALVSTGFWSCNLAFLLGWATPRVSPAR
jgi:hypothetical protein